MAKAKKTLRESVKVKVSPFKDYWGKSNYIFFYLAIGVLILGYFLMSQDPWDNPASLSISPVVLLVGYLVIIPLAILFGSSKKRDKETNVSSQG